MKHLVEEYNAKIISNDEVFTTEADVLSPAALGGVINDETIPKLKVKIVAGAANNQLGNEEKHGKMLKDKGILYAPDYVINAGGLINVYNELEGYNRERALKQASGIYDILKRIIEISKKENVPTEVASRKIANERMNAISNAKRIRIYRDANLFKSRNM